jgi:hypothetical protein
MMKPTRRSFLRGLGGLALVPLVAQAGPLINPYRFAVASGFEPEADTLFAAMTSQPDATRKALINGLIAGLKADGIWSQLDLFYITAAHDAQAALLNWKSPGTFDLIAVNSPGFTVDRGYTGDGASSRLRTQYIPSTHAVNLTQNSASAWVWSRTAAAASTTIGDIGNTTGNRISVVARNNVDNQRTWINDTTASDRAVVTGAGLSGTSRTASGVKKLWKDGSQLGADFAVTSTGLPTTEQWVLGANSGHFSVKEIAAALWGSSLSGLETSLKNRLQTYMTGVGA